LIYTKYPMNNKLCIFTNNDGTFACKDLSNFQEAYFPLANQKGLKSSITAQLKGDIKLSNDKFLTSPVSTTDIKNSKMSRNFWVYVHNTKKAWSASGVSSLPEKKYDKKTLEAGLLWHKVKVTNKKIGLESEITNFVPADNETLEIMTIKLKNISRKKVKITATSAIPLYGRSAENIHDHRHVTSLLNRIYPTNSGIVLKPTMVFDEKSHRLNKTVYFCFGFDSNGNKPTQILPDLESFIGKTSDLEAPEAIINNSKPEINNIQGKDAIGALRFKTKTLSPLQSQTYIILLGINDKDYSLNRITKKYNTLKKINSAQEKNKLYWKKISNIEFDLGEPRLNNWLKWVNVQPILRKTFGCSFLPHFDYGKGNRGWRDIWQDYLNLIINNSCNKNNLRSFIINSLCGVRIDGTNATIVAENNKTFISDRNSIPRVWMDHGIWPFFTIQLYLNYTDDTKILFSQIPYFNDGILKRAKLINPNPNFKKKLLDKNNRVHKASLLEHIMLQHLVQFFNVGKHNNIRLEDADWNDGLDMASEKGESVAFSSFYAENLKQISELLKYLNESKHIKSIKLTKEILPLFDTLSNPINYNRVHYKISLLDKYFWSTKEKVSGTKVDIPIEKIISDLKKKSIWIKKHIKNNEFLKIDSNTHFFNGYYDNRSKRVEGKNGSKINIMLQSQVFPLMNGLTDKKETLKVLHTVDKYLGHKKTKTYRLNTDFLEPQINLGRAFSFSYGDKENGSIFSHMNVMFAYALLKNSLNDKAWDILNGLYTLSTDYETSKTFPNLPEYFNLENRGLYSYLTGSASWFIFVLLTEIFGIKGDFSNLLIQPKLCKKIFMNKSIGVNFKFLNKSVELNYLDKSGKKFKNEISNIIIKPKVSFIKKENTIIIKKTALKRLPQHIKINISIR